MKDDVAGYEQTVERPSALSCVSECHSGNGAKVVLRVVGHHRVDKDCLYGITDYQSIWIFAMVTTQTIGYGNSGAAPVFASVPDTFRL
jgi:hypothetical protein